MRGSSNDSEKSSQVQPHAIASAKKEIAPTSISAASITGATSKEEGFKDDPAGEFPHNQHQIFVWSCAASFLPETRVERAIHTIKSHQQPQQFPYIDMCNKLNETFEPPTQPACLPDCEHLT